MMDKKIDITSLTKIDRIIHEPARLVIMAFLFVVDCADFIFLMNQIGLTWGNLSAHMSKLEEAGYLSVEKTFKSKRPNTLLRLTPEGQEAFSTYCVRMRQLFTDLPG
jgi:DNA-binding MarR family transcriptional regulator